jgi:N-acetylneuraminic acid mutarotase
MEHVAELRGLLGDGKSRIAPSPRYAGVIFPAGKPGELYISGGCRGGNLTGCLGDLWKYRAEEDSWDKIEAPSSWMTPRCGHSAVTIDRRVFFFGGTSNRFTEVHDSLHRLDLETGAVDQIAATEGDPPERLVHVACADRRGRMWIFGGLTTDRKALGDLWCYDPEVNRWEVIDRATGERPGPRYGARLACVGDSLYLFGGNHQGSVLGDLYRFDTAVHTWTRLDQSAGDRPSPRFHPALLTVDDRIYLFGGGDGRGGYFGDLYVYDASADRWEKLEPTGEAPGPRGCPLPLSADGKRIYLFSGAQRAAQYGSWINGDLYVYDVAKNEFAKLRSHIPW